jgi:Tfp pilus assembly protein PilV
MKRNRLKKQAGIALVEVIAALGIAVLTITALASLSISTLRSSLDSKLLLEGTKIANKQVELVRAYRDGRTWDEFIYGGGGGMGVSLCTGESVASYCHIDSSTPLDGEGSQGSGSELLTYRFSATNIDGSPISSDPLNIPSVVRISVSVNWQIGDETKGTDIYTDLSNWRAE